VIKIPMRECVIRTIYKMPWIASLRKLYPLGIVLASACVETQFIASYRMSLQTI